MIYSEPSYLTGLVIPVKKQILSEVQESYGEYTSAFKFNVMFKNIEQNWYDDFQHYGGTIWGIDEKSNRTIIFDQFQHGYNGVMKINKEEDLTSIKNIKLAKDTEIIIAFQYSGDETENVETGASKFEQDYFGWVVVYTFFNNQLKEIFNYECA